MNPERFALLRELLLTLQSLESRERAEYLEEFCRGDEELRREAESLLDWDRDSRIPGIARTGGAPGAFDLPPAAGLAGGPPSLPERIGSYRVLGVLGRGGMGVVYRAQQTEPIRREVAVKRVHAGFDGSAILARFGAERQILAVLEHPGIARVFDAGEDADGAPFFVMELVRGAPITEYCRGEGLSAEERLRLFAGVCRAVQHAHQKGIVHRDLKPSNVLVTEQAGEPAAKVIDFGIAKTLEDALPGGTLTLDGQVVGTLAYMSPEQVGAGAARVDTRSDVYSLGVLLYELVTGRLPHDVRGLTIARAARVIAEEPARAIEPALRVDPDIATILFAALEKDPERRYAGAAALGEDIERFLDGYPILAHPPSTAYQIRKMVKRNKLPFALAGALFLFAVASAVTMGVLFQGQRIERARAEAEGEKARQVGEFLREMLGSVESRGERVTVREVLDEAARDVEAKFGERPEVEAALHSTIGSAYTALGAFEEAKPHLEQSLEIRRGLYGDRHPDVAESLGELAEYERRWSIDRESMARAESLAVEALAMSRESLSPEHPDVVRALAALGWIRTSPTIADHAGADSLFRKALSITRAARGESQPEVADLVRGRARALMGLRRRAEAEACLREALTMLRALYPGDHSAVSQCLQELSVTVYPPAERESLHVEALAMERRLWGDGHPNLYGPLSALGKLCIEQARFEEAEPLLLEALAITEAHHDPDHELVARACNNLGALMSRRGDAAEAVGYYRRAMNVWRAALGETHNYVFIGRANLAVALGAIGEDEEAWALFEEGVALARETHGPRSSWVAFHLNPMAGYCNKRGRYAEAEEYAREAAALWEVESGGRYNLASTLKNFGRALLGQERHREAEAQFLRVDSLFRSEGGLIPAGIGNLVWLGKCYQRQGRWSDAERTLREAEERHLAEYGPSRPADLARILIARGDLCLERREWNRAAGMLEEAGSLLASSPADDPDRARVADLLRRARARGAEAPVADG